ncbi:unnamed protein product, partial [Oppiella nova]
MGTVFTKLLIPDKYWTDAGLRWNPSDFGGQTQLVVSSDIIWMPYIHVINGPDILSTRSIQKSSTVYIVASGAVEYWPKTQLRSYCETDLTDYPSDRHTCQVAVGTYYRDKYVDIYHYDDLTGTDQDTYLAANTVKHVNPEWEFISAKDFIIQDNDMIKVIPKRKQSLLYYFITTPIIVAIIISIVAITFPPNSVKRYRLIGLSVTILFVILTSHGLKCITQNINKYGVYLNDDNVFSSDEQIICDDITITSN